ncbi:MAG: thioredoxin domain-containing protein [Hespellia sp.]|nr:thioredoxin domain-containing protein [Hespellia sp.]
MSLLLSVIRKKSILFWQLRLRFVKSFKKMQIAFRSFAGVLEKRKKFYEKEKQASGSTALEITTADIEELKSCKVPAMIDFGAKSCGPCKEMAPTLEVLNNEWQGKAVIHFMDVGSYNQGLEDFPLQVIPTQFFFDKDGLPFVPSEKLQEEMEFIMYNKKETKLHVLTAHQGVVTENQLREIFAEMGVE